MSVEELRDKLHQLNADLLRTSLTQIRPEGVVVPAEAERGDLLDHLISDICLLGTGALLDQLQNDTIIDICQRFRVPLKSKTLTDESRLVQQEILEAELKKKGHNNFLSRLTAKQLRTICFEIKINKEQKKPEMQQQLSEEIVLLGTESFFDLVERDTLQLLGEAMHIEPPSSSSSKEDVIDKYISAIFDLAPLEDALKFTEISSSPVKKEEVPEAEEVDEMKGESKSEEKSRKKFIKTDSRPEICDGILRNDLQKFYTVPELRTFAKENLHADTTSLIKLKKEQLVNFILEKLAESGSSSKKRPSDRHDSEPPGKKLKTDNLNGE